MQNQRKVKTSVILLLSFVLSSCASMELTKQKIGAVTGAVVGGIAGSKLASKAKGAWTFVGATAGAFIGSKIGKYLDKNDKDKMSNSTKETIATGDSSSWKNSKNNTSGTTSTIDSKSENTAVNVKVLKGRVERVPPLEMIGSSYRTKGASNLRGGPGVDYTIVGSLEKKAVVNVIGKVKGKPWYLISQGGVGSGFISESLVEAAEDVRPDEGMDNTSGVSSEDVVEQQVPVERICRTVQQSVTLADGSTRLDQIKACQGPNGWEIQNNA